MGWLLTFHGEMRWLVILVAGAVAVRSSIGWLGPARFRAADRVSMTVLTVLLDLNVLFGLVLLLTLGGGFPAFRLEHAATMILAAVAAHSTVAWRRSEDGKRKFRNNLFVTLAVLVLVVTGVLRLRGAWVF